MSFLQSLVCCCTDGEKSTAQEINVETADVMKVVQEPVPEAIEVKRSGNFFGCCGKSCDSYLLLLGQGPKAVDDAPPTTVLSQGPGAVAYAPAVEAKESAPMAPAAAATGAPPGRREDGEPVAASQPPPPPPAPPPVGYMADDFAAAPTASTYLPPPEAIAAEPAAADAAPAKDGQAAGAEEPVPAAAAEYLQSRGRRSSNAAYAQAPPPGSTRPSQVMEKTIVVRVEKEADKKIGFHLGNDGRVIAIKEGMAAEYNAKADEASKVTPGDLLIAINEHTTEAPKHMKEIVENTPAGHMITLVFEKPPPVTPAAASA